MPDCDRHQRRYKWQNKHIKRCLTLCNPMGCNTPGLPVHHQLPEFTQTHVHWVSDAIQPSHVSNPLLFLPSIFPSIRVFSNELVLCIRWPKYWSFSFSISPSNEYSGLISFRSDWLDLLAVQGSLKSLLQHHSSKASILQCLAFFIVQHSHPHMTTGKIIALTRQIFVGKVMSLLFNMLSRLVITFLPRSKCLLEWPKSRMGFPGGSVVKNTSVNAVFLIPELGGSPGKGSGNPQYYWKGNSMDRGAWKATVHGFAKVRHDWATKQKIHNIVISKCCPGWGAAGILIPHWLECKMIQLPWKRVDH